MDKDTALRQQNELDRQREEGLLTWEKWEALTRRIIDARLEAAKREKALIELKDLLLEPFERLDRAVAKLLRPLRRWMQRWRS